MYFYKAFFKDGEIDYIATNFPVRQPKLIDATCIKIQHISAINYLFHRIFHFGY